MLDEIVKVLSNIASTRPELAALVLIVGLFLVALRYIVREFGGLVREHMQTCNETLNRNNECVAQNTQETARVTDALNRIATMMPKFGCAAQNYESRQSPSGGK